MIDWSLILSALLGGGGLFGFFQSYQKEKSITQMNSATYFKTLQETYATMAVDTAVEIGQMREQIKMLKDMLNVYKEKCDKCSFNQPQ